MSAAAIIIRESSAGIFILLKPARVWAGVATAVALGNQQVVGASGPEQGPPVSGSTTLKNGTSYPALAALGTGRMDLR